MRSVFEPGDTRQFTIVTSVAPDAAFSFAVYRDDTLVESMTSIQSSSTAHYALFTMPGSFEGVYIGEWKGAKTIDGVAKPFVSRFQFAVQRTTRRE